MLSKVINLPAKNVLSQTMRGLKSKGDYFNRYGFKYNDVYKGGKQIFKSITKPFFK